MPSPVYCLLPSSRPKIVPRASQTQVLKADSVQGAGPVPPGEKELGHSPWHGTGECVRIQAQQPLKEIRTVLIR